MSITVTNHLPSVVVSKPPQSNYKVLGNKASYTNVIIKVDLALG